MAEDITPEELAEALAGLAQDARVEAMAVNDIELQRLVGNILPDISKIEKSLQKGVTINASALTQIFKPLVNTLTKPIFDIRKTLSGVKTTLTSGLKNIGDNIRSALQKTVDFLNTPIFDIRGSITNLFSNVKDYFSGRILTIKESLNNTFSKIGERFDKIKDAVLNPLTAFKNFARGIGSKIGGFFGMKSKEQREEEQVKNPAKSVINYMKKNIEPLLKKIKGRGGDDGDKGFLSKIADMLAPLSGVLGSLAGGFGAFLTTTLLPALTSAATLLAPVLSAIVVAAAAAGLGTIIYNKFVSPFLDKLAAAEREKINLGAKVNTKQRTTSKGGAAFILVDPETGKETFIDESDITQEMRNQGLIREVGQQNLEAGGGEVTGAFTDTGSIVAGAEMAKSQAEVAQDFGLEAITPRLTRLRQQEDRIKSLAIAVSEAKGTEKSTTENAFRAAVREYKDFVRGLESNEPFIKALGKQRHKNLMKSIKETDFYESLDRTSRVIQTGSGMGMTTTLLTVPSAVEGQQGVAGIPEMEAVIRRRQELQAAANEVANAQQTAPAPTVVVQNNSNPVVSQSENYFTSTLEPEKPVFEFLNTQPMTPGAGVLLPGTG